MKLGRTGRDGVNGWFWGGDCGPVVATISGTILGADRESVVWNEPFQTSSVGQPLQKSANKSQIQENLRIRLLCETTRFISGYDTAPLLEDNHGIGEVSA